MNGLDRLEVWFLTGSQGLYGPEALRQVEADAARVVSALDASPTIPVHIVARPVVTSPESIRQVCLEANMAPGCIGVIAWMHTFSPARMWIAGLRALQQPLLHLHTQTERDLPWSTIDMDFMNVHQSAHGDREFGFIETRMGRARKTVVGHWQDPAVQSAIGAWSRAAAGWHEAQGLRVARFGDNMREVAVTEGDKVEAQMRLGVAVNGYGVTDLVAAVRDVPEADVDALIGEYESSYALVASLRPGGHQRPALREAARIERGLRTFLDAGGFKAFTDTFEDTGRPGATARDRRTATDGRWVRLRRGGRLEGGRPGAAAQGHGRGPARRHLVHGGLHLPPWSRWPQGAWRAYAGGVPDHRRRQADL